MQFPVICPPSFEKQRKLIKTKQNNSCKNTYLKTETVSPVIKQMEKLPDWWLIKRVKPLRKEQW